MPIEAYYLKQAPYEETWALQERLRARVLSGGPEVLLFCEHTPVVTLGRSAAAADVLAGAAGLSAAGVACIKTSRGGQVTYHGPGQLTVYPIVRLRRGVVAHVEWLASAVLDVARDLNIDAEYSREKIGVFVGTRKLAAIGVQVSRRVAIHGLALNVTKEATAAFSRGWFIPCGDALGQAISLEEARSKSPSASVELSPEAIAEPLKDALCRRAELLPPRLLSTFPA